MLYIVIKRTCGVYKISRGTREAHITHVPSSTDHSRPPTLNPKPYNDTGAVHIPDDGLEISDGLQ